MSPTEDLDAFKNFLGAVATEYTEAELEQLRDELHIMAELLLDIYLYKRHQGNGRANQTAGFDAPISKP